LKKLVALVMAILLTLAACDSADDEITELPTRFIPPTFSQTPKATTSPPLTPTPLSTSTNTFEPATSTPSASMTQSPTATLITLTPSMTITPSPTSQNINQAAPIPQTDLPLNLIELPPGFEINIYSDQVPGARSIAQGEDGTIYIGTRRNGVVYALKDLDGNHHAETVQIIARDLNSPNGVAVYNGALYVAEINRITRYDDIAAQLASGSMPVGRVIYDDYPNDGHHGWKFIRFGLDGKLYIPQGVPCNICAEDERYGYISRINPDGGGFEVVARGVRNSVGFDFHPQTGELWFTDNGRDWLGDDLPPDELNYAPTTGMHFGFPYCHAGLYVDDEFGFPGACQQYTPPVQPLGPHVAALGMRFYTGQMFPPEYAQQIFIAEHGSWNRSVPIGYRVSLVRLDGNNPYHYETFASGWLQGFEAWGRPVDVHVMPDGALLVSDDLAGAVYRISYVGQ